VKIGCSLDLKSRVAHIAGGFPDRLEIVALLEVVRDVPDCEPMDAERWFHRRFADKRRAYEWFDVTPEEILEAIEAWRVRPPRRTVPLELKPIPSVAQRTEALIAELGGLAAVASLGRLGFHKRKGVGRKSFHHAAYLVRAAGLKWKDEQ